MTPLPQVLTNWRRLASSARWQLAGLAVVLVLVAAFAIALLPLTLATVALAGIALAVALLVRPWVGLPFLALAIPFAAVRPLAIGGVIVDGTDVLLALVLVAWLAQGIAQREIVIPSTPLLLPLGLLIGALALSLFGAASYQDGLLELIKWIQVALLYLCLVAVFPAQKTGWLLAGLLAAGALQALLGIHQFLTQAGPEPFILLGRFMRAYGTFRQPNPYAGYLGLIAPLALSLAIWAWTPGRQGITAGIGNAKRLDIHQTTLLRVALPLVAGLISLGLLLSWSRGAWIAFTLAAGVVVLAHSRRAAPLLLAAGGIVLAILLVFGLVDLLPGSVTSRLSELQSYIGLVDVRSVEVNDNNFSVIERVAHWEAALAMWADHPWTGVGAGNYAAAYAAYALPRWYEPLGHAHNVYLNMGAEAGLLGFLTYLALWLVLGWQALRAAAQRDRFVAAVGAGVLGALVHATVHNMFDSLWVQHLYLLIAMLFGLLAVLLSDLERARRG